MEKLFDVDPRQIVSIEVVILLPISCALPLTLQRSRSDKIMVTSGFTSATRKETDSHLNTIEISAYDSYSFSFLPLIQCAVFHMGSPLPFLSLSLLVTQLHSQNSPSVRDVFTVAYRMQRTDSLVPNPFAHECESSKCVRQKGQG